MVVPIKNRRLPSGEKGSLKYYTALNGDVSSRLIFILARSNKFFNFFISNIFNLKIMIYYKIYITKYMIKLCGSNMVKKTQFFNQLCMKNNEQWIACPQFNCVFIS